MKQEITPNARNKQEFPPSRIGESNASSIVLYTAEDNSIQLDVKLENETVWLSQQQMALLFATTPQNITMHIRNIYKVDELQKESTCKDFLQVRKEGKREVVRNTKFYNLDLIISVGYRVNTKRGIQFRQWANKVLKDYLVKGYAVNQKITQQRYEELKDVVRLMSRTYQLQDSMTTEETDGLLTMIGDYVYALDTLDHYDFQQLSFSESFTTVIPTTQSLESASNTMDCTPVLFRPIARTSLSLKRTARPPALATMISLLPLVSSTPTTRSSSRILMAITPFVLGLLYSVKQVFFTIPFLVQNIT